MDNIFDNAQIQDSSRSTWIEGGVKDRRRGRGEGSMIGGGGRGIGLR